MINDNSKPNIHVTRNGEIYVMAGDVVKSKKFQVQVKKMAEITVNKECKCKECKCGRK